MRVDVWPTAAEAARRAAAIIAARLARDPRLVLGLPTGRTTAGIYDELARLHARGRADFSRAHTVNLDEFIGLGAGDSASFRAFMETHLFTRVNLPRRHAHFLNGRAIDADRECRRFERLIATLGGIDLQLLGLGENGHIGFNEPAAVLHARTHVARLTLGTRRASAALFGGRAARVPARALTMGIATILDARAIVLVATGRAKARAVRAIVEGGITTAVPASLLQLHPVVHVIVDEPAASRLGSGLRSKHRPANGPRPMLRSKT